MTKAQRLAAINTQQPARFIPRGLFRFQPPIPQQPHMIPHLHKHIPHPCQPLLAPSRRFPGQRNRKWFLIPLAALVAVLALSSCSESGPSPTPPPVSVDTAPVGEGLKLIGFALLGAAVVTVLGRLIR